MDRRSVEDLLASLTSTPWSGRVFRVMLADYPPDRENTQGARWNPPDIAAIYTCIEASTCVAEVNYNLTRQPKPTKPALRRTLYQIDVTLSAAVDLTPLLPKLAGIGITQAQLFADDMEVSQEIGRIVTWLGHDGLIAPSARSDGKNLVIYPAWTDETHRFEVLDQTPLKKGEC